VTVVDVRGRDEYTGALGHIPKSLNIPLPELQARLPALEALKQQPLVLVCRTDMRSAKAAELLRAAGFAQVEVLRGGMTAWSARG
jgi:rhodanese-related sulfurtransferase